MYQPYNYYPGQLSNVPMQQQFQADQIRIPIQQGLAGRMVSNLNEINAQDLPMNGTQALFPLSDGSAIYARAWRGDGTVQTVEYRPVQTQEQDEAVNPLEVMQNDISEIKDMLQSLQKPKTTRTRKANTDEPAD